MNTALIGHIMNQRLKKGEIWPPWLGLGRMPWLYSPALVVLFQLPGSRLVGDWALSSGATVVGFGRLLYVVAGLLCFMVAVLWPLAEIPHTIANAFEKGRSEALLLVEGHPTNAFLSMLVPEIATYVLRLSRFLPLFAIAAAAGALDWRHVLMIYVLFSVGCIAQVAFVIAVSAAVNNNPVIHLGVGGTWALWCWTHVSSSVIVGTTFDNVWPVYILHFVLLSVVGFAAGILLVNFRLRPSQLPATARRPRTARFNRSRFMPAERLLSHGAMSSLGFWGTGRGRMTLLIMGIGLGFVPFVGGIVLFMAVAFGSAYLLLALHREAWWDEIWLSVADPADWRRAVVFTFFRVCSPVVPGMIVYLLLGRMSVGQPWSTYSTAHALAAETNASVGIVLVVTLIAMAAMWAITVCVACIISTIDGILLATYRAEGFADPNKAVLIALLVFGILFIETRLASPTMSSIHTYEIVVAATAVSTLMTALMVVFSYRRLLHLLPRLWETDHALLEDTVISMNSQNKWYRDRRHARRASLGKPERP